MPKPLPHHWRKLTSHKLSSANDVGQADQRLEQLRCNC